jgi:hypothetical protein
VAARLLSLKREVGELLGDEMSKEELDQEFEQLPSRYLVSATPEEVVSQYRLERQLEKAVLSWQVEEKESIWELTLMSRQPLGLLTMAAGTLTLNQLDIRKAKTHTKKNGVAFQTFEVAALKPGMEISWEQVMADLEKTIQGRLALDYRLAVQKENGYPQSLMKWWWTITHPISTPSSKSTPLTGQACSIPSPAPCWICVCRFFWPKFPPGWIRWPTSSMCSPRKVNGLRIPNTPKKLKMLYYSVCNK